MFLNSRTVGEYEARNYVYCQRILYSVAEESVTLHQNMHIYSVARDHMGVTFDLV